MASIRKYRTSRGELRCEVRWRERRRDRSKVFNREADAKRFKVDVESRQQLGALYSEKPEELGAFKDGWLARYEQQVRPSTYATAIPALNHWEPLRLLPIPEIRAAEVEDRVARLARRSPRQAQRALALLRQVLKNARERGQVVDQAIFALDYPRSKNGSRSS